MRESLPILSDRPALDDHDVQTVRQLYGEAQQWSRHYETLIVNVNVLLVSSGLIFLGLGLNKDMSARYAIGIFVAAGLVSATGILLTATLFKLYASCVNRMMRLENLLNCFDPVRFNTVDGLGALLPKELARFPVQAPPSVRFFFGLHAVFIAIFAVLGLGMGFA